MSDKSTVTIDTKTAEGIFAQIGEMEQKLALLKKQLAKLLPSRYGSKTWWEKEEAEADKDIKAGRVAGPFDNAKDLQIYLDSLK